MHYQYLKNFIGERVRKNDIFVPAMILFLIKNEGEGTIQEIARLLYIFDFRYDLDHYDTIVEKFAGVLLEEYNIVRREKDRYFLQTWPLSENEIFSITKQCMEISNGFFTNLHERNEPLRKAS